MAFEGPSMEAPSTSRVELARQKFGVDLNDATAVRSEAIKLSVNSPKAQELLQLWNDHDAEQRRNSAN